jgi:hypothetical protein
VTPEKFPISGSPYAFHGEWYLEYGDLPEVWDDVGDIFVTVISPL